MSESPENILREEVNNSTNNCPLLDDVSIVKKPVLEESSMESQIQTSSSFLPDNGSQMSRDVDLWINGSENNTPVNTGVQRSRLPATQRSMYTTVDSNSTGGRFLYMLTILIPLIKTHQRALWSRSTGLASESSNHLISDCLIRLSAPIGHGHVQHPKSCMCVANLYFMLTLRRAVVPPRASTAVELQQKPYEEYTHLGAVLNSLEPVFTQIGRIFNKIHGGFHRFTTDHIVPETLTTALDVILVIYAIGFLFIALYQSSNMA